MRASMPDPTSPGTWATWHEATRNEVWIPSQRSRIPSTRPGATLPQALNQMPGGPMVDNVPPQMRMSHSVDFSRGVMGVNTPDGAPPALPPQGFLSSSNNIMGQPFIELRHRAPQNRMGCPLGMDLQMSWTPPTSPRYHPRASWKGQEMGFAGPSYPE
nr:histone-lysine N-methyltransferase 2C [Salvelinus alpinus]